MADPQDTMRDDITATGPHAEGDTGSSRSTVSACDESSHESACDPRRSSERLSIESEMEGTHHDTIEKPKRQGPQSDRVNHSEIMCINQR